MEDPYEFILNQKHLIELECLNLNRNSNYLILPDNIDQIYNDLTDQINRLNSEQELLSNSRLVLDNTQIKSLLKQYDDGIYGIINYYPDNDMNRIVKLINDEKYDFQNKPSILKKLLSKNNTILTDNFYDDNHGFLFLYDKKGDQCIECKKLFLLKNGDIDSLNNDNVENEKIITKIYHFQTKIVLKKIVYNDDLVEEQSGYLTSDLETKKKELDGLYKMIKKYRKYLDDNIKKETKDFFLNFSFIKTLLKKIKDPTKQTLSIDKLINHDFSGKFSNIKCSNRLDGDEYNDIINKYFDENLDEMVNEILNRYSIDVRFRCYIINYFDILIRIFIDDHLGYKTYCLSSSLSNYFNTSNILAEPDTSSISLKKRYWNIVLESEDSKRVVSNLLDLLNNKTKTIDSTLKYLEQFI
jgi:hypothetical protein